MSDTEYSQHVKPLACVIGASEFPHHCTFNTGCGGPAFKESSRGVLDFLVSEFGDNWEEKYLLNLFDNEKSANVQVKKVRNLLKTYGKSHNRLIVYYVGHGGFFSDREYYLAIRATEKENEHYTAISVRALADSINNNFSHGQVFLILDCCFAGEAVRHFQSFDLPRVIESKTLEMLPISGTAMLCASSIDSVAISKGKNGRTQFSECLIEVLTSGIRHGSKEITLRALGDETKRVVRSRFGNEAVLPEVHSPRQIDGMEVADLPLFRNSAWQGTRYSFWQRAEHTKSEKKVITKEKVKQKTKASRQKKAEKRSKSYFASAISAIASFVLNSAVAAFVFVILAMTWKMFLI